MNCSLPELAWPLLLRLAQRRSHELKFIPMDLKDLRRGKKNVLQALIILLHPELHWQDGLLKHFPAEEYVPIET